MTFTPELACFNPYQIGQTVNVVFGTRQPMKIVAKALEACCVAMPGRVPMRKWFSVVDLNAWGNTPAPSRAIVALPPQMSFIVCAVEHLRPGDDFRYGDERHDVKYTALDMPRKLDRFGFWHIIKVLDHKDKSIHDLEVGKMTVQVVGGVKLKLANMDYTGLWVTRDPYMQSVIMWRGIDPKSEAAA